MYVIIQIVKEPANKIRIKTTNYKTIHIRESYLAQISSNSRSFYIIDSEQGHKQFIVYTIAPILNSDTIVEKTVSQLKPVLSKIASFTSLPDYRYISDYINTI